MREIKFRAWANYGEMLTNIQNHISSEGWAFGNMLRSDAFEIMQYTGLKDANGVEIYFGDVVPIAGYGDLHVKDVHDIPTLIDALAEGDMGAIKGNIHANPEILEAE